MSRRRRTYDAWLSDLDAFIGENGHADVPSRHRTSEGYHLGQWLINQRNAWRERRLSPERVAALESRGVSPGVQPVRNFADWLADLDAFVERNGYADVPRNYRTPEGDRLGEWLHNQRAAWRQGRLAPERVAVLESRGVSQYVRTRSQASDQGLSLALPTLDVGVV
jgi:hypothetical protein